MTSETHAHGFAAPPAEKAPYLDTQTMGGDKGYFHTENAPTHATDGKAKGASDETALTKASRQQTSAQNTTTTVAATDDYESWKNADLIDELERRGIELPDRVNKANLVAALRG